MLMLVLALLVLGLCLGSFVNALVWRLHEKQDWVKGRSKCTKCGHELSTFDLIPVASWLLLGGKCRYCHKKISIQYPIVELVTATIFLLSYLYWPVPISGHVIAVYILWLVVVTGLIALSVYDIRWMILPSKIIYALYPFALIMAAINIFNAANHIGVIIGYVEATIIGGGIFYVLLQVSRGKWIGGGDVRLGFLLGLVAATALKSFLIIFIASLIGSLVSFYFLSSNKLKHNSLIPFGPFLIIATIIVQLAGAGFIHWYTRVFLGY